MEQVEQNEWKPKAWVILPLGFLTLFHVFLYSNRVKYFWIYLFATISLVAMIFNSYQDESIFVLLYVICPLHALYLNRNYDISTKRPWYSKWWGVALSIMILIFCLFVIRAFFIEPFRITADSMKPTLNTGDIVLVNKVGYGSYGTYGIQIESQNWHDLELGEIYVFRNPDPNNDVAYVKRLIGKAGDSIEISDDKIYLNGDNLEAELIKQDDEFLYLEEVIDDYLYSVMKSKVKPLNLSREIIVVPDNHYYFLGDNRDHSLDSRFWGTVPSDNLVGKVSYVLSSKKIDLSK